MNGRVKMTRSHVEFPIFSDDKIMVVFKLSNVRKSTLPLNSQNKIKKEEEEELPSLPCDRA